MNNNKQIENKYVQITNEEFKTYKSLKKRVRKLTDHFFRVKILVVRLMILNEANNDGYFSKKYNSNYISANIDAAIFELNDYVKRYERIILGIDNDAYEPADITDY